MAKTQDYDVVGLPYCGKCWQFCAEETKMVAVKTSRTSLGAQLHQSPGGGVYFARKISHFFTGQPARTAVSLFVLVISVFTALFSMPFVSAEHKTMPL